MLNQQSYLFRLVLYFITFIIAFITYYITKDSSYLTLFIIGAIGFTNVEIMYYLSQNPSTTDLISKLYGTCYISCDHPICKKITMFRGSGYFLTTNPEDERKVKTCMLSLWGVLHILLFILIGYFVPNKFWIVLLISIIYESAEYMVCNCHDLLDVLLNMLGYVIGVGLSKII